MSNDPNGWAPDPAIIGPVKGKQKEYVARMKTEKDHAEGKPSSETLNKAKVKTRDALT